MALRQEVAVPKVESQLEREHRERYRDREDDHDCGRRARFRDATWRGCGGILASPSRVGTTGSVEYDHPRGSTVPHRFFGLPDTIVRVDVRLVPARWVTPDGEWRNPERDVLSGWHECDHPRDPGVTPGWPRVASPIAS